MLGATADHVGSVRQQSSYAPADTNRPRPVLGYRRCPCGQLFGLPLGLTRPPEHCTFCRRRHRPGAPWPTRKTGIPRT